MIHQASVVPLSVSQLSKRVPCTNCPPQTDASKATTPKTLIVTNHFPACPPNRIAQPMATAIGIVAAIVNNPHGLSASAFTTTSPSTASKTVMIATMLTNAARPAKGPTSSRTICASDFPLRRTEQNIITQSCTAPPSVAPTSI